jgi:hypothetical protein
MADAAATIASLAIYPLKSARGLPLLSARVGAKGLVHDREMMAVDEDGKAITARASPTLLQIRVALDGDEVVLFAPGRPPVGLRRSDLLPARDAVSVWGNAVSAHEGNDAVTAWLSAHLGRPARLVLQDDRRPRRLDLGAGGVVSLADTAPLLLASAASLAELNLYLEPPAGMERFRPNVVVSGAAAFDEDGWAAIRIGEVEFAVAGPCDRCVMITLDPETGEARPDREPLALLGRQRRGADGKVYFGQFLIPLSHGRIHVGDAVAVLARKRPLTISPGTARKVARLPSLAGGVSSTSGEHQLTCVGIADETPDLRTFRFVADAPFSHLPGQFITLLPGIGGAPQRRNYTISSSPSRPFQIAITVKRAEGGQVSRWLHDGLRVGDRLMARGPNGRFHLGAAGENDRLLLLSAGSGVTPMMSILRFVADTDLDRDIVFHHSARSVRDLPFLDELALLQRQLGDRLGVSWNLTGAGPSGDIDASTQRGALHSGRLSGAMLRDVCPDLASRAVFCCGPAGFRATARAICEAWQPAPPRLFLEESFGADPETGDLPPIAGYSVVFRRTGRTITGTGTTTILAAARQAGIALPSDCEAGICGACRCTVADGEWRIAANAADLERSVLSDAEKASGVVLACSTSPIGPVTVDL